MTKLFNIIWNPFYNINGVQICEFWKKNVSTYSPLNWASICFPPVQHFASTAPNRQGKESLFVKHNSYIRKLKIPHGYMYIKLGESKYNSMKHKTWINDVYSKWKKCS